MINGAHVILYSRDAEADRAFFRDVLRYPHVDGGGGWLIFKLPPAEERGDVGTSIHLHATDARPELNAEWLIELGDSGFTWHRGHDKAAVALRGPLADVLRVFYRRLPAGSARVEVLGQGALLDYWLERVSLG
ncbi:hypothetical protein [Actinacidiphila soli]|uniref:hypothetical protein n=1 Tax=Actinacidiphila soli TaxID=2487275 RepID=UPI000FCC2C14|nr:hypothetical protein [Actinacidiphila soli]